LQRVELGARLATADLPGLSEMTDEANAPDEPPFHELLHAVSTVAYEREWLQLWQSMDAIGRTRLVGATGQGGALVLVSDAMLPATRLDAAEYCVAARRVLGLPEPRCAFARACGACGQALPTAEMATLHFAVCGARLLPSAGTRGLFGTQLVHQALKRGIVKILQDARCTPVEELGGLIADTTERPGDVCVVDYMEGGAHLAIDVSCVRTTMRTWLLASATAPNSATEAKENDKRRLYEARCLDNNVTFVSFLMDEYGHIGHSGLAFLLGLAERTAARQAANRRAVSTTTSMAQESATLYRRWRTYMAAELHGAIARIVMMLAHRARKGSFDGPDQIADMDRTQ
jgi:hypothetical protein